MTQEEKAQAYDEVLNKAKIEISTKGIGETVNLCYQLFPELAESEDENLKNKSGYYKDGKFWKASTLWNATKNKIPQRVSNRYILQECTWNIGNLQDFADEVKNVQEVSLDYPIILDMNGNILDGAHRVVKAYLEGKDVDIVYLGDDEWPEPDYDEEKAVKKSDDEKIRKSLIKFLTDIKEISESGRTSWAVRKEDAEMCKSFIAWLKKQKECVADNSKTSAEEDERIMDTIIEHFKGFSPIKVFGDFDFTSNQILAYLEKMKEQKPIEPGCPQFVFDDMLAIESAMDIVYRKGNEQKLYEALKSLHSRLIDMLDNEQKEQRPVERSLEDDHIIGFVYDLLNEIEWKDNWAMSKEECLRLLSNYSPQKITRVTINGEPISTENKSVDIPLAEWSEKDAQKLVPFSCGHEKGQPAEKQDYSELNDLERAILRGFLAAGVENVPIGIIKDTASECVGFLALTESEPVEWSEEDESSLKELIHYFESLLDCLATEKRHAENRKWLKFLKSLRPQSKQEWNNEDESILNTIITDVEFVQRKCGIGTDEWNIRSKAIQWLKNLLERFNPPKQEWKEVELEFRSEKVKIKRPFFRDDKGREYSTTEQDEDVAWYALRAWCEKKGVSLYDLYPKDKWNEEDEEMLEYVIGDVNDAKQLFTTKEAIDLCDKEIAWLKSLRPQPKLEWSEEDKKILNHLIDKVQENWHIRMPNGHYFGISNDEKETFSSWLKSLPERFNLQPKQEWSEEDKKTINNACCWIAEYAGYLMNKNYSKASMLMGLTEKLKSLHPQSKDEAYKEKDEAFKLGKHQLAIKFMNYLDENRPEGKMNLSNGECEDIDKAFEENDWAKIMRYAEKYGK